MNTSLFLVLCTREPWGSELKGPETTVLAAAGTLTLALDALAATRGSPLCCCHFLRPLGASRMAEGQQLPLAVALVAPAWNWSENKLTYTHKLCILCSCNKNCAPKPSGLQEAPVIQQ